VATHHHHHHHRLQLFDPARPTWLRRDAYGLELTEKVDVTGWGQHHGDLPSIKQGDRPLTGRFPWRRTPPSLRDTCQTD
jgi:hypothetical protein